MPTHNHNDAVKHKPARPHAWAWFDHFAKGAAWVTGRPATFLVSIGLILVWLMTGQFFNYSDTWQLIINTGTTIITFLMVFLIQNTQNRDTAAVHLKLDELIRAIHGARNSVLNLEDACEEELLEKRSEYIKLAEKARHKLVEHGIQVPPAECADSST